MGTAVVNDATAAYYNPAALVLLNNTQFIVLGSVGDLRTQFAGESTLRSRDITEAGSAGSRTNYYFPSIYLGMPATDRITLGLSVVANSANRDITENSILRYAQASNNIADLDIVPAVEFKINKFISLGAGVNLSYSNFHLKPITLFPRSNIGDSDSDNQADGTGIGANVGVLVKLAPTTIIGFNYRSVTNNQLSGKSVLNGVSQIVSNDYHFKLPTPARSILSINHFVTPKMGFIATVQRIQWSVFKNIDVYAIATPLGVANANVPYYLRDTWVLTLGNHYRVTPKWVVRVAGTYNQSPGNPNYQIINGDSVILGASTGYEITKHITIDAGYVHAFMKSQNIDITSNRILITGVNDGARDAFSLKLIFNIL